METEAQLPRLLTAQEVAEQTALPLARVYELAREGLLPSVRLGRAVRFSADALRSWFESGGSQAGDGPEAAQ